MKRFTKKDLKVVAEDLGIQRFSIKENTPGSWMVWDSFLPTTPKMAIAIFVRQSAAERICDILNDEWKAFLRNPD